ncbi:glutathione S-transferase [Tropicimonas isoalkanivorans]|uniref:glutathione transferase n=1 Tax=Tropicimonas isoalkanivorans TaxID=441112 RepID=A0A1I1LU95_9RHOB|nr:glutathione S-transferase [Tropicimonas isoalkanivorans]SFC76565.1 Glutathione S-transferase [Tropicimonas isoalkanivorans]
MQLYHSPASPFVRKVMVTLHETGQTADVEIVPAKVTPMDATNAAVSWNPLGKIPTLVRDDGPALFDSRVICRFLDARAGAALYPSNRLWEVMTLEALSDGIMEAAVLMVYESRCRPQEKIHDFWVESQWAKVARALDVLEARWSSLLAGPLHIGQIATGCALGYLDFRHGGRDWRAGRDALATWEKGFAARPSMQATFPTERPAPA